MSCDVGKPRKDWRMNWDVGEVTESLENELRCANQVILIAGLILMVIIRVFAQGQVLHYRRRNLGCSSAECRSSTANLGAKAGSFTRD